MAWGRSSIPKPPPPSPSILIKILPLIFLLVAVGIFAFIGYHIYLSIQKISGAASSHLESRNVVLSKDGIKVVMKGVRTESYVDKTQNLLVKAWNLSTLPAYKSRLGWNKTQDNSVKARKPYTMKPAPVPAK